MVSGQFHINSILVSSGCTQRYTQKYTLSNHTQNTITAHRQLTVQLKIDSLDKVKQRSNMLVMLIYVLLYCHKTAVACFNNLILIAQIWNLNLGKFKYFDKYLTYYSTAK